MHILNCAGLAAILALSACGAYDNRTIETPANTVLTAEGPVTCQHYIPSIVWFDRAWVKPEPLTTEEANAVCQAEGKRLAAGGERHHINAAAPYRSAPTN